MGIFKDLFRDIAESRLSQRELYIKWAQEKASEGDWDKAGYFYKEAGESERAGDAYMQCWNGGIDLTQLAPTHCGSETQPTLRRAYAH